MADLQQARVVLTGATGGIGRAIARLLSPRSEWLLLAGRNRAELEALRQELGAGRTHIVCGDLCAAQTREELRVAALALGGANLLVNNAGCGDFHAFSTQEDERIRQLLETNLLSPMLLTRALLPQLQQQPAAQVINIGSIFGYIGFPGFGAYCAGKFGLRGFSQSLRRELADTSVAVRYFAPRATRTPFNADAVTAMNRELGNAEDLPEEVARAFIAFLSSSDWECKLGAKERFFVLMNQLFPALPDKAIAGQLPIIRKHLPL